MRCYQCGEEIEAGREEHYGLHPSCFCESFGVDGLPEFTGIARLQQDSTSPAGQPVSTDTSFFQGKFRKYDARLEGVSYILKVEEKQYPELPIMEFLCNQIAVLLGIEVPQSRLIRFYGVSALAVMNFIRPGRKEALHHIHHFIEGGSFDCETLIRVIGEKTSRLFEIERFIALCLFDSLIGNHDRHGRNLGLIEEAGQYRLAPFYDNPSYLGIEEAAFLRADHSPRGRISTKESPDPVMTDYVKEFKRLGFIHVVEGFRRSLKIDKLMTLTGWSFLSAERAKAFNRLIMKRAGQLNND